MNIKSKEYLEYLNKHLFAIAPNCESISEKMLIPEIKKQLKESYEIYKKENMSITTVHDFNYMVKTGQLKYMQLSSDKYLMLNRRGEYRRYGYVAYSINCAFFGLTKEKAIAKYKKVISK